MRPIHHIMISGVVTSVLAFWVRSFEALAACFLSGIFIDLDHHLDYLIEKRKIPLSYRKLWIFCHEEHGAKMYLFFHSYELHALLWISIFAFSLGEVWLGLAVGISTHMICDEIVNPIRPLAYFLIFRAKHGFSRAKLLKQRITDAAS